MMQHNPEQVKFFTDSVLFFLQDPDPKVNQVMVSYITGAILPIVSLCMTSMVVNAAGLENTDDTPIDLEPIDLMVDVLPTDNESVTTNDETKSKIVY